MSTPSILQIEKSDIRYLLDLIKSEVKRETNCHAIGTIITFDATTATASVAFNYKKILKQRNAVDSKNYTDVIVDYPVLIRCPVIVLGGGGSYTTYPIFSGDQCLIMFCDRDIDLWLELGSTSSPPSSERMHDISDAVVLVGLNPVTKPIPNYLTNAIQTVFGQVVVTFSNLFASIVDSTGQRLCQSGFGQPYFGSAAPSGWLLCFGQAVSRTTYASLFAAIGTTYGTGNGTTTFNLPDMRGKTIAGLDNMGGTNANVLTNTYNPNRNTLGALTGQEAHALTIPELPSHNHTYDFSGNLVSGSSVDAYFPNGGPHGYERSTNFTGNNTAHQNVQPTMMVNWIIKI